MLSYVSIILTTTIGLMMTPFIIRTLGDSEFGLYTLIGALVSYFGIMDFGLNNTIVRFIARYRAKKDKEGEENFLATTMLIYCFISVLVIIAGTIMYFNLELFFKKLTPVEMEKAKTMFVIVIFNLAIGLPGGAFAAISSGYEHFVFPRTLNIIKYISRSLMVIALLMYGGDAIGMVILDSIFNILVIIINGFYVLRRLKVKYKLHYYAMPLIKEIFSYSIWVFVFAIFAQFQWRSGQVILGSISGTTAVAIYGVGVMLGSYYGAFSSAISGVFLPRATKMTVLDASADELTDMMIRIGRFSAISLLLILGGFLLYGKQFVDLWVGKSYRDAYIIALIIMFAYTVPLVQSFANAILEARRQFSFKALTYISLIVIGTGVGAYLVRYVGTIGIIIGLAGGWLLGQVIMNFYYHNKLGLQIPRFYAGLFHKLLPTYVFIIAIGYAITFIPGNNWINLGIKIILFAGVYVSMMYKFGLNAYEISTFRSVIPFIKK